MGEREAGRPPPEIRLIEWSEDVVYLLCSSGPSSFEVMAQVSFDGTTVLLSRLIADGAGANSVGVRFLRECARLFARRYGATWLEIHGGERASGAAPGHLPRRIRLRVD